jgi:hypothetical protein
MKIIARHQEGISLNPYEFVMDDKNEVKKFKTDEEAVEFLNESFGTKLTKEELDEEGIFIIDEES